MTDHLPDANKNTKKARKEFQNQYFVGGMRSPAISVKRLGLVKEAGQDILRLWNAFLRENPVALDAARSYSTEPCCLDDRAAKEWSLQLGRLLKVEVEPAVKLKGKFGFQSPLNAPICGGHGRSMPGTQTSTCISGRCQERLWAWMLRSLIQVESSHRWKRNPSRRSSRQSMGNYRSIGPCRMTPMAHAKSWIAWCPGVSPPT